MKTFKMCKPLYMFKQETIWKYLQDPLGQLCMIQYEIICLFHMGVRKYAGQLGYKLTDPHLEAILCLLPGKDTFLQMPTIFGKSLVFNLLLNW